MSQETYLWDVHFNGDDIINTFEYDIRGKNVSVPRGKGSLKPEAMPRTFPKLPGRKFGTALKPSVTAVSEKNNNFTSDNAV